VGALLSDPFVDFKLSPDGETVLWWTAIPYSDEGEMGVAALGGSAIETWRLPRGLDGFDGSWSADGTKVVYELRHARSFDIGDLYVRDLTTGDDTRVTGLEGEGEGDAEGWSVRPRFSPDARSILYNLPSAAPKQTWSVPVTGGEPTVAIRNALEAQYLPDGRIAYLADSGDGQRIMVIDQRGDRHTLATGTYVGSELHASPDGTRVAYEDAVDWDDRGAITILDLATGETAQVTFGEEVAWVDDDTLLVTPGD
jgi:Tol biopolymer transport system component